MSSLGCMTHRVRALAGACFFVLCFFISLPHIAFAGTLTLVSDTVSNSAPSSTSTSHLIRFTVATAIPASGNISIAFPGFTVPASLDFTDIDLAVNGVDRTLAALPSVTDVGVTVVPGTLGTITLTLSSGSGIAGGDAIRISIGDIATFGGTGDQFVESPGAIGSHHVRFTTRNAANVELDIGSTLVVIIAPVGINLGLPIFEAIRSNGLPSGLFPGSTQNIWLSLNTDIQATCRYATTSGNPYSSMLSTTQFTTANGETLHYRSEAVATNTVYAFYVRCQTPSGVPNSTDFLITFEIGVVPNASTTPPPPPPPPTPPSGGGISGPGGGGGLFLNGGDVTIEGRAAPNADLIILKDGVIARESKVSVQGNFSEKFTDLQRGTYSWGVYIRDSNGRLSSVYSSTIYLIARTNNIIAPVYVSPTMTGTTTVGLGDPLVLSGYAIPLTPVQVIMNKQGDALNGKVVTGTTTANGNGAWTLSLSTDGLPKGTYQAKAQSLLINDQSLLSPVTFIGVGENPNPSFVLRSDLNKDKKVNLVDFSILLFNWRTADPVADINQDGTVNLVDFSIMLANWTG